jgi:hypothetical protein
VGWTHYRSPLIAALCCMDVLLSNLKVKVAKSLYLLASIWCVYLLADLLIKQWWRLETEGVIGVYSVLGTNMFALPSLLVWGVARFMHKSNKYSNVYWLCIFTLFISLLLIPSSF